MKAIVPPSLTNKEWKALRREIDRQTAQNVVNLQANLQAAVLWQLHANFGFGKKRLLRFAGAFQETLGELLNFYEMESAEDSDFICKYKLKNEVGIDVNELESMFNFKAVVK